MLHLPARRPLSRREALSRMGSGFGMLSFAAMVSESLAKADVTPNSEGVPGARIPNFKPKAKHVIFLFMNGGASQVDTFDYKPMLDKYNGKPLPGAIPDHERKTGNLMQLAVQFQEVRPERHGSQRDLSQPGRVRRRHVHDPVDVDRHPQPRAVAAHDEYRAYPTGPAVDGVVDHLRAGHREQESAGLRGALPRSANHRRAALVELGVSASHVPGHVHCRQRQGQDVRSREADPEHPQRPSSI